MSGDFFFFIFKVDSETSSEKVIAATDTKNLIKFKDSVDMFKAVENNPAWSF